MLISYWSPSNVKELGKDFINNSIEKTKNNIVKRLESMDYSVDIDDAFGKRKLNYVPPREKKRGSIFHSSSRSGMGKNLLSLNISKIMLQTLSKTKLEDSLKIFDLVGEVHYNCNNICSSIIEVHES